MKTFGTKANYFLPNLAHVQRRRGHTPVVHILTSSERKNLRVRGFDVHFHRCLQPPRSMPLKRRFRRQLSLSLIRGLKADEIDVIHFHGLRNSQLMLAAVALRARQIRVPLVGHDQGTRPVRFVERRAASYAAARIHAFMAANAESASSLRKKRADPTRFTSCRTGSTRRFSHPRGNRCRSEREIEFGPIRLEAHAREGSGDDG